MLSDFTSTQKGKMSHGDWYHFRHHDSQRKAAEFLNPAKLSLVWYRVQVTVNSNANWFTATEFLLSVNRPEQSTLKQHEPRTNCNVANTTSRKVTMPALPKHTEFGHSKAFYTYPPNSKTPNHMCKPEPLLKHPLITTRPWGESLNYKM